MALQVEDGTGRADAESLVSVAEIGVWASARGLSFTGTEAEQEISARKGADYLRNGLRFKRWRGTLMNVLQRMPYPRIDVVTEEGLALPDGTIPWQIKEAQCALAVLTHNGLSLQPNQKNGGMAIASKSLGPISTSYVQTGKGNPISPFAAETIFTEVIGYLAPLLLMSDDRAEVSFVEGEVPEAYQSATYDNLIG